jgi:hypothetical protein
MFTTIPKFLDRSFFVAFVLPAFFGGAGFLLLFHDNEVVGKIYEVFVKSETTSKITWIVAGILLLSTVLALFNHFLYRTLEGYHRLPFISGMLLRAKIRKFRTTLEALNMQIAYMKIRSVRILVDGIDLKIAQAKIKNMGNSNSARQGGLAEIEYLKSKTSTLKNKIKSEKSELIEARLAYRKDLQFFRKNYPREEKYLLPTHFGNKIRAFELYTHYVYGVESTHAWPRLESVISKEYRQEIYGTRAQVDCMMNMFYIFLAFSLVSAVRCIIALPVCWLSIRCWNLSNALFPIASLLSLTLCFLCYGLAVSLAEDWGELVKSSFDLYLPELAEKLGFELPGTAQGRRAFWSAVTWMVLYWQPIDVKRFKPAKAGKARPEATDESAGETSENEAEDGDESEES